MTSVTQPDPIRAAFLTRLASDDWLPSVRVVADYNRAAAATLPAPREIEDAHNAIAVARREWWSDAEVGGWMRFAEQEKELRAAPRSRGLIGFFLVLIAGTMVRFMIVGDGRPPPRYPTVPAPAREPALDWRQEAFLKSLTARKTIPWNPSPSSTTRSSRR